MRILLLWLIAISLFVAGCTKSYVAGPGKILGPPGGEKTNHKTITFYVVGKGLEPDTAITKGEAVLMAERAAVVDGYRQLAEKLHGVYVDAFMRSGSGRVDFDTIQIQTQAWIRGAELMEISKIEHGITVARLRLRINFAKRGMIWWPVGLEGEPKTSLFSSFFSN